MKKHFRISTILSVLVLSFSIFFVDISKTQAACSITSAKFDPSGLRDINWFKESSKPLVRVHVVTNECTGQTIELSIVERDAVYSPDDDIFGFDNRQFTIPESGKLTIIARAGEDDCEQDLNLIGYNIDNADCHYYIQIVGAGTFDSKNKPDGDLYYDCDGVCDIDWAYRKSGDTELISADGSGNITNEQLSNDTYTLLAPLPGIPEITGNEGVATFLEKLFIIMISLAAVLAVLSLIYAGFQYITTGVFSVKTDAKDRILNSILGLLLALGAFVILNTINPDLVNNLGLNIDTVTLEAKDIQFISAGDFTQITGSAILSPTEYDDMARTVSGTVGIPYCALKVILERESKGNPGAIGFDENVSSPDIPSRIAFINSGKRYDGSTFTAGDQTLIKKKTHKNQTQANVTNTPTLGLDWRFSKGIGLTQITLFPPGYFTAGYKTNPPDISLKDQQLTYQNFTPKQLLDPMNNLTAGATLWKNFNNQCGTQNIEATWRAYASGSCNTTNGFAVKEAKLRTQFYNQCIQSTQ